MACKIAWFGSMWFFFFMGIPQIHCLYWSPTDLTSSKGQHSPSHRRHRPTRQYARKSWGKLQETGSSVYWQWGPSLGRYYFQICLIYNVIECKMRCKTNYNNISTILFFIHLSNNQVSVPHPVYFPFPPFSLLTLLQFLPSLFWTILPFSPSHFSLSFFL